MPKPVMRCRGSPVMSWPSKRMSPLVRPVDAADAVEERGLAGAVRADQPADLPLAPRRRRRRRPPSTPPKRMTMSWTSSRAMRLPLSAARRAGARGRRRMRTARAAREGGACNLPEPRHEPFAGLRRLSFLDWEVLDRAAALGASHQTRRARGLAGPLRRRRPCRRAGKSPGEGGRGVVGCRPSSGVGWARRSDEVLARDPGNPVEAGQRIEGLLRDRPPAGSLSFATTRYSRPRPGLGCDGACTSSAVGGAS